MKEWLLVNWRTFARLLAVVVLYALAKWFPGLEQERETVVAITEVLGLGVLGLTPGLRAAKREDDLPDPPEGGPP